MNNFRNNNRKNRFKTNGDRFFRKRSSNNSKHHTEFNANSDFKHRNPGRNNQNAAKLVDKYNNLAREALSSGDKILSESYFQHADHFMRIVNMQEINKDNDLSNNVIEQNFKKKIDNINSKETKNDIKDPIVESD